VYDRRVGPALCHVFLPGSTAPNDLPRIGALRQSRRAFDHLHRRLCWLQSVGRHGWSFKLVTHRTAPPYAASTRTRQRRTHLHHNSEQTTASPTKQGRASWASRGRFACVARGSDQRQVATAPWIRQAGQWQKGALTVIDNDKIVTWMGRRTRNRWKFPSVGRRSAPARMAERIMKPHKKAAYAAAAFRLAQES